MFWIEVFFKVFYIGDLLYMKLILFKLNDGLLFLCVRICIDGVLKFIYLNVEVYGESGVIDVVFGLCLDMFVFRVEILSGCEGVLNCLLIYWENWCYEDGKLLYIGF